MVKHIAIVSSIGALTATSALANVDASATTDLNLRAGPTPQAEIIDVIPGEAMVNVDQCVEASKWCRVNFNGQQGWAYGEYLTAPVGGEAAPVAAHATELEVETVTVENDEEALGGFLTGGAAGGILALAAAGGPAAIAGAAAAGAFAGGLSAEEEKVVTYIRQNPVEPVYLQGEVVKGAGIPQEVTLQTIPESGYRYAYVNGVPVVVDDERRIIEVVR